MPTLTRPDFDISYPYTVTAGPGVFFRKITAPPFFLSSGTITPSLLVIPSEDQSSTVGFYSFLWAPHLPELIPSGSFAVGVAVLQSSRYFSPTTGSAYAFEYHWVNGQYRLLKTINGVNTATTLRSGNTFVHLNGDDYPISLLWFVDPQGEWTYLEARIGDVLLLQYQDFDTPYITGVCQSSYFNDGGSASPFHIAFSQAEMHGRIR